MVCATPSTPSSAGDDGCAHAESSSPPILQEADMTSRSILGRVLPVAALALALIVALGLAACGSSSSTTGTSSSGSPQMGGTRTLTYLSEPSSLDPAVAYNVIDWNIEHDIFQSFFRYVPKPGEAGTQLEPCLATQVPSAANGGISNGGKTITIHLRSGVMFQPPVNREVTAQDFKYSFERMLRSPLSPGTGFYTNVVGAQAYMNKKASTVKGFKVIDPSTVEVDLMNPDLSFLNALTMEFTDVIPKEWVDKWGKKVNRHPLGTGPFVFDHWTPGQEIVLNRNPNYWESGKPYLDQLVYRLSYNPSTALLKLQKGEVDVLGDGVPPADLVRVAADPKWKPYVQSQQLIAISYVLMNVDMKPFDNLKVRQAVSWAIDRDKVVKLLGGQAAALWQLYPPGLPGHEQGKKYYGYDPAKAKALLTAAGFPNGFKTTYYTDNVDPDPKIAQSVQADLAAIGIRADLKTVSNDTLYALQGEPGKVPMGSFGWWMDFPDPVDWFVPLFSKSAAVPGGMNASFWWSPTAEKLYAQAQLLSDPQARLAKFDELQSYILSQAPYATVYAPMQTSMCSTTTGGFYLHPVYQFDPANYWTK
jgi:ABC-type transport system substrate-binding protein